MAAFGAKYPRFAPNETVDEEGVITYDAPVTIGSLNKADLTVTMASGKVYGDNELQESVDEFVSGAIAMETVDMEDAVAGKIYGATVQEKLCTYNTGDTPPEGGLGYYKTLVRGGKKVFKTYFYPRVKAAIGNDTAATKADSITFSTVSTNWTVMAARNGNWRLTEEHETEEAAKKWLDTQMGVVDELSAEKGA